MFFWESLSLASTFKYLLKHFLILGKVAYCCICDRIHIFYLLTDNASGNISIITELSQQQILRTIIRSWTTQSMKGIYKVITSNGVVTNGWCFYMNIFHTDLSTDLFLWANRVINSIRSVRTNSRQFPLCESPIDRQISVKDDWLYIYSCV